MTALKQYNNNYNSNNFSINETNILTHKHISFVISIITVKYKYRAIKMIVYIFSLVVGSNDATL